MVENDDKPGLFTIAELMPLHEATGIPLTFDFFHHKLYSGGMGEREAFNVAVATWPEGVTPVCHYSDSRRDYEDPAAKREAHSDWVYNPIPIYGRDVDVVLETKMKELSLLRYREQFLMPRPIAEVVSA